MFKHHHYLSQSMHPGSTCFVAIWRGIPVAFVSWLQFPSGSFKSAWKGSRLVCLPDYQGVGIGNALSNYAASIMAALGRTPLVTASHPALIQSTIDSGLWQMTRVPSMQLQGGKTGPLRFGSSFKKIGTLSKRNGGLRLTAGFRYIGPPADIELALAVCGPRPAAARR